MKPTHALCLSHSLPEILNLYTVRSQIDINTQKNFRVQIPSFAIQPCLAWTAFHQITDFTSVAKVITRRLVYSGKIIFLLILRKKRIKITNSKLKTDTVHKISYIF